MPLSINSSMDSCYVFAACVFIFSSLPGAFLSSAYTPSPEGNTDVLLAFDSNTKPATVTPVSRFTDGLRGNVCC